MKMTTVNLNNFLTAHPDLYKPKVNSLKEHLATLENELSKAKGKIVEQQGMIRLMEHDKDNMQRKFQDDLKNVSKGATTNICF